MPTYDELLAAAKPAAMFNTPEGQEFNAKLTIEQRSQVLALASMGFKRNLLSRAYGIHRATVRFITNRGSPHYKGIRKEYDELGERAFCEKYLTAEIIERVSTFQKDPVAHMSDYELRQAATLSSGKPSRKADSKQGPHRITSRVFDGTHLFAVGWVDGPIPPRGAYPDEAERESGWYVFAPPDTVLSNAALFGELTDPPYCYTSQNASRTSASALAEFLAENEGEIT